MTKIEDRAAEYARRDMELLLETDIGQYKRDITKAATEHVEAQFKASIGRGGYRVPCEADVVFYDTVARRTLALAERIRGAIQAAFLVGHAAGVIDQERPPWLKR